LRAVRGLEAAFLWVLLLGLGFSISLAELALAMLALCWAVRLWEPGRWSSLRFPLVAPVLAFSVATLLSALASPRPLLGVLHSKSLLLFATFYLLLHGLERPGAAFRFLSLLSIELASVSIYGIVQVAFCPSDPGWIPLVARFFKHCARAHAFYSIYMTLAGVLSVGLLAVLPRLLLRGSQDRRWWVVFTCAAETVALGLTYVRGAWVGVVAGLLTLMALVRRGRWPILAVLIVGMTAPFVATPGLRHRALSVGDLSDPTVHERLLMWRSGVRMAREHALAGVGPGRVRELYPAYVEPGALRPGRSHVHNTPLQILVERGPLGLLTWLWLFVAFFAGARRSLRSLDAEAGRERALVMGSVAATAGFLVSGLFEYNFGDAEVAMVTYSVMALGFPRGRCRAPAEDTGPAGLSSRRSDPHADTSPGVVKE
jgi:putative inorganic carbon (HCO3(-)) transporter